MYRLNADVASRVIRYLADPTRSSRIAYGRIRAFVHCVVVLDDADTALTEDHTTILDRVTTRVIRQAVEDGGPFTVFIEDCIFCDDMHMYRALIQSNRIDQVNAFYTSILQFSEKKALFLMAAKNNRRVMLTLLLDNNMEVDHRGANDETALMYAAKHSSSDVCTLLLDRGADIHAKNGTGNTPLHYASAHGNLYNIDLLLSRQADKTTKNDMQGTPLMVAIERGQIEAAELLIDQDAICLSKCVFDNFLVDAIRSKYAPMASFLMRHGIDPDDIETTNGYSLLDATVLEGSVEMVQLLVDNGAKRLRPDILNRMVSVWACENLPPFSELTDDCDST